MMFLGFWSVRTMFQFIPVHCLAIALKVKSPLTPQQQEKWQKHVRGSVERVGGKGEKERKMIKANQSGRRGEEEQKVTGNCVRALRRQRHQTHGKHTEETNGRLIPALLRWKPGKEARPAAVLRGKQPWHDSGTGSSLHIAGPKGHRGPMSLEGPADPRNVRPFTLYETKAQKENWPCPLPTLEVAQTTANTLIPLCCDGNLKVITSLSLSFSSAEQAFGNTRSAN